MSASEIRFDHPKYWPCKCPSCGWRGMSDETAGGNRVPGGDDYNDCVCPVCIAPEGNYEKGGWVPVVEIPKPPEAKEAKP